MIWAHPPRHTSPGNSWPRAGFGLPIIGQFQRKSRKKGPDGGALRWEQLDPSMMEPPDFELRWKDHRSEHDRLASPLIVKALPLAGRWFVPCALWLNRTMPQGAKVGLARKVPGTSKMRIDPRSEAPFTTLVAHGDVARFGSLNGATSLRDAFFRWLSKHHTVKAVAT